MTAPAITQLAGDIYRLDDAEVFEVPSRSRPGVLHLVVRHVGWHCTCPASVTACFHVRRVREALADPDLPERTP